MAAGSTHDVTPPVLPERRPAARPKPGPGRAAPRVIAPRPASRSRPRPAAAAEAGEQIKAPGLAALLHRHPKLAQRGAVGAIASGIAVFVIACITTPLAAANVGAPPARRTHTPFDPRAAVPSVDSTPAVGAVQAALRQSPTHATKQAPVSHGVISGLAANGIPRVALNAYRVAAARMAGVQPGCGIDWALLAGIGREESDHGRFGGAVLHADGVSTPSIIGPALDGVHWDYIPAPANGVQLDGDAKFAHALGPMQFIPSTWDIYGTDADGDRNADVFDINDAALAAARYLCAAGGNLRTRAGQIRGVLAYNHSGQYLAQVLALADAYRRGVPVSGLPVGITSGALPAITNAGYIPPANPGPPTAAGKTTAKPTARSSTSTSTSTSTSAGAAAKPAATTASSATSAARTPTAPASTTSAPAPTRTSSTASPTPAPTSTPAPSPSTSCNPLNHLLGKC